MITIDNLAFQVKTLREELEALKREVQPVVDSHKPDPEWARQQLLTRVRYGDELLPPIEQPS